MKTLHADGNETISFDELNRYLEAAGVEQFTYDLFAAAFENDPRLQKIVSNFNGDEINFKQGAADDLAGGAADSNAVAQMAQNATDVGAPL